MYSKFLSLETEKRDRIINAALKEFSQKGYKNASTNEMVKEADISKGLLFHYFKSKKGLYLFLYGHITDILVKEVFGKVDWNEGDIIKRLKEIAIIKLNLFQQYPEIFNFMLAGLKEDDSEIKTDLEHKNKEIIANSYARTFENIDTSLFKEGIEVQKAINVIIWTLDGIGNKAQETIKAISFSQELYDHLLTEYDDYIQLLQHLFYK